jgi:hypothetical protein
VRRKKAEKADSIRGLEKKQLSKVQMGKLDSGSYGYESEDSETYSYLDTKSQLSTSVLGVTKTKMKVLNKRKKKGNNKFVSFHDAKKSFFEGLLSTKDVCLAYDLGRTIGEGKCGIVKEVVKKTYNKLSFAMKNIPLEKGYEHYVQREFDILCKMDHPMVMKLVEVYFDQESLNLVLPLYDGGELFTQVEKTKGLTE